MGLHAGAQEVLAAPHCGRLTPLWLPVSIDAGVSGRTLYLYLVLVHHVLVHHRLCSRAYPGPRVPEHSLAGQSFLFASDLFQVEWLSILSHPVLRTQGNHHAWPHITYRCALGSRTPSTARV